MSTHQNQHKQCSDWERTHKNSPIHNSYKKFKLLEINLIKDVNDLYDENYKAAIKKWKTPKRWKNPSMFMGWKNWYHHQVHTTYSKQFPVNMIPRKIHMAFFSDLQEMILKSIWIHKDPVEAILNNKNKARGFIIPDFKIFYRAIIIKTVWY